MFNITINKQNSIKFKENIQKLKSTLELVSKRSKRRKSPTYPLPPSPTHTHHHHRIIFMSMTKELEANDKLNKKDDLYARTPRSLVTTHHADGQVIGYSSV